MQIFIITLIFLSLLMVIISWREKDKQSSLTFFIAGGFLIFCFVALKVLSD